VPGLVTHVNLCHAPQLFTHGRQTLQKKKTTHVGPARLRATTASKPPPALTSRHAPPPHRRPAVTPSLGVLGVGVEARRPSPHVSAGVEARRAPWGGGRRGGAESGRREDHQAPDPASHVSPPPPTEREEDVRERERERRETTGSREEGGRGAGRTTHGGRPCRGGETATPSIGAGRATEESRAAPRGRSCRISEPPRRSGRRTRSPRVGVAGHQQRRRCLELKVIARLAREVDSSATTPGDLGEGGRRGRVGRESWRGRPGSRPHALDLEREGEEEEAG
jgi:hypothetical protein